MKTLLDSLDERLIKVGLVSTDFRGAIDELVKLYSDSEGLREEERREITRKVIEREMLQSTLMENSVAVPHAKIQGLKKASVILGTSKEGVDFGINGKGEVIFLVLTPEENPSEHISLLSSIAKVSSSSALLSLIKKSRDPKDLIAIIRG